MNPFRRIRWRLAGLNLLVVALVLVVTIGAAALTEARARDAATERELRLGAERELAAFGREQDEDERAATTTSQTGILAFWVDRRGTPVHPLPGAPSGLPDMAALQRALAGQEVWTDRETGGGPYRLLSVPVYHERRIDGAIQVGKPLAEGRRDFAELLTILLLTGGGGLALAALGSLFLADRAMRPIRLAFEQQRRFIADASHELRTPVAVLRARAEVLEREGTRLPPEQLEQVQLLREDATELTVFLEELLDLARLDAGQAELTLDPVALSDVAEEVVAQLGPLAVQRHVRLQVTTQAVWARANLPRLRQVLRALVDNALKHTPAEGSVWVEVTRQGSTALLRVRDTGEGIAATHLPKVTERFYRVDAARARPEGVARGGAGLGLAIAAELVTRMRGSFHLESQEGKGTVATVSFPLADRLG
jgi:signal transduction histidine kinase